MGKMLAADAAWAAGEACIQTFGGFGFAEEYDIERKYREARLYQVAPISTNLILSTSASMCSACPGPTEMASQPLKGLLVVSMEQAVAAPYCASRLADAGARVIKIERAEGDFARAYDAVAKGQSSYFVWLNRGKESLCLDIKAPEDKALLERLLEKADVFIQNLAPGAMARRRLRLGGTAGEAPAADHPRHLGLWRGGRIRLHEGL